MNLISMSNMMSTICNFLVIFSVISNVHGTELTAGEIRAALDAHNFERSHVGAAADMRKLVWSDQLASNAQNYANLCEADPGSLVASSGRLINIRRETLQATHVSFPAVVSSSSQCDSTGTLYYLNEFYILSEFPKVSTADVIAMVREWASEKENFNSSTRTCSVAGGCNKYKQLVWASTSQVGCGIKRCSISKTGANLTSFDVTYAFVCDYNPAGNIGDQKPYRQGRPCSQCNELPGPGPWTCDTNLCVPQ